MNKLPAQWCRHEYCIGMGHLRKGFGDLMELEVFECVFCRARFLKNYGLDGNPVAPIDSELAWGWMTLG